MKRTFYKTLVTVEVLSEEPLTYSSLQDLGEQITTGDCSGRILEDQTTNLNAQECAGALMEQGSDPGFFMIEIDEDGNVIEEAD